MAAPPAPASARPSASAAHDLKTLVLSRDTRRSSSSRPRRSASTPWRGRWRPTCGCRCTSGRSRAASSPSAPRRWRPPVSTAARIRSRGSRTWRGSPGGRGRAQGSPPRRGRAARALPRRRQPERARWLQAPQGVARARAVGYGAEAREIGLEPPRGLLLVGVQGCGKSLSAKFIAREWRLPLLKLDAGRLYDKYVGESERNFRRATALAESMAPCVLWIDEIEKGLSPAGGDADSGLSRRLFGSFLTWLQEKRADVFVVATANDLSLLPPELLRKGRFDETFFVDLPTVGGAGDDPEHPPRPAAPGRDPLRPRPPRHRVGGLLGRRARAGGRVVAVRRAR